MNTGQGTVVLMSNTVTNFDTAIQYLKNVSSAFTNNSANDMDIIATPVAEKRKLKAEFPSRIADLLNYLEGEGRRYVCPELIYQTRVDWLVRGIMFEMQDFADRAEALWESYEDMQKNGFVSEDGWQTAGNIDIDSDFEDLDEGEFVDGNPVMADDTDSEVDGDGTATERPATSGSDYVEASNRIVRSAPPEHPYWGVLSIMYGVRKARVGGRWRPIVDTRYKNTSRPANVVGHNGNGPGAWFPYQVIALFCGAHGASQAGVYGNAVGGAYSIVLSKEYTKVNSERNGGNTIFYAGPESKEWRDPINLPNESLQTGYLRRSVNQLPVRVLRSSYVGMPGPFSFPGLRYDGLYMIEKEVEALNDHGGKCKSLISLVNISAVHANPLPPTCRHLLSTRASQQRPSLATVLAPSVFRQTKSHRSLQLQEGQGDCRRLVRDLDELTGR